RSPNEPRVPIHEALVFLAGRMLDDGTPRTDLVRISAFGILSDFGFRISDLSRFMNPIYFLGWCFFRLTYRVWFRRSAFNPERVPRTGPVILASNHESYLDPMLVGATLPA